MVTLAGLQNVVAGGGGNDGQGDGVARGAATRGWTLKSTRRVATTREREAEKRKKGREQERWKGREKDNTGEFTSPGEFLQDLISRARARATRARA